MENMNLQHILYHHHHQSPQATLRLHRRGAARGATIYKGEGYYTHGEDRTIVLTALYLRRQASQRKICPVDPKAFILIPTKQLS